MTKSKILVVDDDEELRTLLSFFLRHSGCDIDMAENGKAAFEMIHANKYDLVISDVRMPIWDGLELIKHVSQMDSPPVPMIFMSGYAGENEDKFKNYPNFISFLPKPIRAHVILKEVQNLLDKKRMRGK